MPVDPLSVTFAALADPTRRAILAHLSSGEATVSELAAPFGKSLPAISRHLKVLRRAGLIEQGRKAQWRPCRLQAAPLEDIDEWLDLYRHIWEERYDRLDEYLTQMQARPEQHAERDDPATGRQHRSGGKKEQRP
jgi:DNA-binding transcriptional ArsR family regulator